MIEVTQIRKSYGKKKVLSDITFQVKPGEWRCDRREKRLRQIYLNADHGGHFKAGWR